MYPTTCNKCGRIYTLGFFKEHRIGCPVSETAQTLRDNELLEEIKKLKREVKKLSKLKAK